ncbi:MAG: N-acetylmuramyl-L-alanine amidase, negative regulator of AmpC, AmpD [Verrucomicrobiales bacterium]|nr:N-acetylmuramyl-L-alanine amidase, negative regulator of AmpC, AmpD [Verrucomicrobiales bacterium]
MNKQILSLIKYSTLGVAAIATTAQASTDYGPAVYRPMSGCSKWYTTGNGHIFAVCHDIEGYYASTISYLNSCSVSASIHYIVNGKQDTTSDYPAGEISQSVREANYAWHVRCWNTWSTGTEHEGFASNPAWYTTAMYNASGLLQRHLMDVAGKPKDRNHIIGHDEKKNAGWVNWVNANYSMDPTCNTHTDPGANWSWSTLMAVVNPPTGSIIVDNTGATFTGTWATGSSSTDKYGADYRYHSTAAVSEPASYNYTGSGTHTAYAYFPAGSNRSATTPYVVHHSGASTTVPVNQQINGGTWVSLGSYAFAAGDDVQVSCWTGTGFLVMADAVKWQ